MKASEFSLAFFFSLIKINSELFNAPDIGIKF